MCKSPVYSATEQSLDLAVQVLKKGGIVAFPTETYYGLAVDPYNEEAVKKLYRAKRRNSEKPLLLLIANRAQLDSVVEKVPKEYVPLIDTYWPGPLTLVFHAKPKVSRRVTGGTGTIGVRISPHPVAQGLLAKMGTPITATSANLAGAKPAQSATDVVQIFGSSVDLVIDGGDSNGDLCSTIVALKENKLTILRNGQVDLKKIIERSGKVTN